MLRAFHKPNPDEPLRRIEPDDLEAARASGGWAWLDLTDPTPEEIGDTGARFGLDRMILEDLAERVELPKVDDYGDRLLVVLHELGARDGRLDSVELNAVLGSDFLVTVHREETPAIEWLAEAALSQSALTEGGPDRLLARLAELVGRRFLPLLDSLDDRIEDLEDRSLEADPGIISVVQALRRDVIFLRHVLGPQAEALLALERSESPLLTDRARRRFGDVYDHHRRLGESLEAARLLLAAVLDSYRGAVAERMNEVMKVLTVFAAIVLPLSLVAEIYGMNFAYMPELAWQWGYFATLGLMAMIAVGLWTYFARRGFIGGPRLRKLPKAVGLGLVNLAAAPVRTVGWLLFEENRDP